MPNEKPNRDWSSRRHFQGMSPRELEFERRRALNKTTSSGLKNWAIRSIVLLVITGAALTVGYLLFNSDSEQLIHTAVPSVPFNSAVPILESPIPIPTPTAVPTIKPTEPIPTPTEIPGSYTRGSADWISALENEVHRLTNVEREQKTLPLLSQDSVLAVVARGHSVDMVLNSYFEHENLAGEDPTERGNVLGYTCRKDYEGYYTLGIAENIFQGWLFSSFTRTGRNYMTIEEIADQTLDGWMNSPDHRENILTETYDKEGIGVGIGSDESVYVTQNFC